MKKERAMRPSNTHLVRTLQLVIRRRHRRTRPRVMPAYRATRASGRLVLWMRDPIGCAGAHGRLYRSLWIERPLRTIYDVSCPPTFRDSFRLGIASKSKAPERGAGPVFVIIAIDY